MMFDSKEYIDVVTLWMKGYPSINFEIRVKRNQLELLQARDDSQDEQILNQKVTIVIKTFRTVLKSKRLTNKELFSIVNAISYPSKKLKV